MTCKCQNFGQCRSLFQHIFQVTYFFYEFQCRYEAGLLFAYLAFVPFCEAGVMDSLSLQVSYAANTTSSLVADNSFPSCKTICSLVFVGHEI